MGHKIFGTESRSEYGHSPLSLSKWSGLLHDPILECLLSISFDSFLGFFLLEDFLKVLGFAGVVSGGPGVKMDPLVRGVGSGGVGVKEEPEDVWVLFIMSGLELSGKASSIHRGLEEAILGRSGRTDSASPTLDFHEFWRRFGIYKKIYFKKGAHLGNTTKIPFIYIKKKKSPATNS